MMIEPQLWQQWLAAVRRDDVAAAMDELFASLTCDIEARKPTCWLSGKCCRFESYGHDLFVTGLEIAWLCNQLDAQARDRLLAADLPAMDGCPFQVDKLCIVHTFRPTGCRMFFCDPTAQDWQNDLYEEYLKRLRRLHEQQQIEYRYIEWRRGLASLRAAV